MKITAAALAIIVLSGCGQMMENRRQHLAAGKERIDRAEAMVKKAMENGSVACATRPECDKAFRLTKAYIGGTADMRVARSDDTSVQTFASTFAGNVGTRLALGALMEPGKGDTATITLVARCAAEIYPGDGNYFTCMDKMALAYLQFRPYIESRL